MYSTSKIKVVVNDVLKPSEDKRSYRGIELSNGLKALLISDPSTDKSSAALDVNIGHMSDPDDIPGLAHFCEHMLFLGTAKYPEENDYNKFLSEHGGSSNAYTSAENTNYYFDVSPEFLSQALDRFSQFFVCPLFTESATSRELNAVNSENDKNLQNDSWRIHQLENSTCNPSHPFNKFGTGNKETLELIPKQKGLDLRQELLKFHDKYYSSNIMSLAVLGKESVDELTEMVTELFAEVKNKNVAPPEWLDHPLGKNELKKKLNVLPIKDLRMLNVTWPIPDLHQYYKTSPGHYLGHLIGHEGPGSLLSELKKRGWTNSLMAGENTGAKGFMFFNVNVDLTEEGIEHVEDIVLLIFQYLNMLKNEGPKKWIFKECQELSEMAFRFKDKERPSSYTCKLAFALQMFPIKEVLSGPYLYDDYKPELMDMVLNKLDADSIRVYVIGKKFEDQANLTEKWYGTKYSIEQIPEEQIKKWKESGVIESFKLPEVNDFIPTNFDILPVDSSVLPTIIHESATSRLWYCQDDVFKLPKACFTVQLNSPMAFADPLSANLTYMYIELLKDMLNEFTYAAELAGIRYDLLNNIYGLQLSISGYNDKQENLLKKVMEKMLNYDIDEQRFAILKEAYIRGLKNFRAEQPHQHATYYTSMLISELQWTKEELLEAAHEMTTSRLASFLPLLFSQMFMECLVYGNASKDKAKLMLEMLEKPLIEKYKIRPLLPSQHKRLREVQLPDGCCYQYRRENDVHKSSSLEIYYQCCLQETHSNMLLELFCQIISEPCFDILRTQEQLGYIVFSGIRRSHGVQGLRIIIQSDKSPSYVEQRVEVFMKKMRDYIEDMSDEIFNKHVGALSIKRLEKPKKLSSQNNRYWMEIINQFFSFQRDEIEVEHLKTLKKSDVLQFYQELLAHDAPKRHKLTVHVVSTAPPSPTPENNVAAEHISPLQASIEQAEKNGVENEVANDVYDFKDLKWSEIDDVTSFKRQLGLFPLQKPLVPINKSKL